MSKLKSNSSAKKRFKKTGSGKYKCKQANTRHILTKKTQKAKRHRRGLTTLSDNDHASVQQMLPHS